MGSCVSVPGNPDSVTNLKVSFGSEDGNLVIPPSPTKENHTNGNAAVNNNSNVVAVKSQWSASRPATSFGGSKEEIFFDSHAWLESDSEDDFRSVNGDFTPSRGNTPVHHHFSKETPRVSKVRFEDTIPGSTDEPSPTNKKKKLVELFRESIRQGQDFDVLNNSGNHQDIANGKMEVKPFVLDLPPKSAHGTPCGTNSVCSSERTANGDLFMEEKPIRPMQCCLPSLISCRSFSERKKKMGPAIAVIDES